MPLLHRRHRNGQRARFKSPEPRIRLFEHLEQLGMTFPIVVSPLAHVSRLAVLGEGTIILHNALVNAGASIGRNSIINTKALIEHDAVIEYQCHISTAVVVSGAAKVQRCSFIGSNAVLREHFVVGEESILDPSVYQWLFRLEAWGRQPSVVRNRRPAHLSVQGPP